MKTSELTGYLLDYFVAQAEGKNAYLTRLAPDANPICSIFIKWEDGETAQFYRPSTDWSQGGPIIQRESISVEVICYDNETDKTAINWEAKFEPPIRENDDVSPHWVVAQGRTPLMAAMRAYVASKFGIEVEDLP